MCGLKVSRAWFFTRFGHDWPFWSKKGMLLHSSVKVGRKNHSFCFQYGKGFGKWAAHSTWFFWEFPLPKTTTTATWFLPIPRNRSRWCLNHFLRISEDSLPESRTGVNLAPRVSHLPALLEQGGGRIIDPGNEVVRVFQKIFRNNFPNVWKISRAWNRLVSSLRCLRLSPVVRETISLRRKNLVIYCKLCNKCLL